MKKPLIAVPTFPGSNGEVDNIRTLKRCGFDCFVFRWNDSLEKLKDVDGYFFGAGFSYEDRGRSGMVAARDPLFRFMAEEAERGKVIVGNCNGAQVLIESGLIPFGDGLKMCLARNAIRSSNNVWHSPGFLNEWVWIKPVCAEDRCATSGWKGTMHIPIAHGEGRFVTRDPDLIAAMKHDDQIAFAYCSENGDISADPPVTPNGSTMGIAGICNKAGNVVALMPHPERTPLGDPYFLSIRQWIESKRGAGLLIAKEGQKGKKAKSDSAQSSFGVPTRDPMPFELFIDTIITNNEERTVEQAARRIEPTVRLKQYKYVGLKHDRAHELLSSLSFFNPHKELAYVRQNGQIFSWDSDENVLKPAAFGILKGITLLRRDEPDTGAAGLGDGAQTGVCYDCREVTEDRLLKAQVCEVFCNPHSSSLERMSA